MKLTYGKSEKLKSKKSIELLFEEGNSVASFPLRFIFFKDLSGLKPSQIGVSVPKKKVPHAVDRNRIKRLMRESYRLNKNLFTDILDEGVVGMFLFTDRKEWPLEELNLKMKKLTEKLKKKLVFENLSNTNS